jgi:hypothetical protein
MFPLLPLTLALLLTGVSLTTPAPEPPSFVLADEATAYAAPTLTAGPKNEAVLSWTEKDAQGMMRFYVARSTDGGAHFSEKRLVHAGTGIGASRLMRPRVLVKKDGTLVAVFANRPGTTPAEGRPRDSQIVYATSRDGGQTWAEPRPVHPDQTPMVRGFFDATVLANGEIAVAYLRDIAGKAHARDLRLVVSQDEAFGAEQVLEPFVCDCCNISLLVDAAGALHVYYRENRDNTRDIDHLVSTDHGKTFAAPRPLYADNWKINGCPHSGPTSSRFGSSAVVAWYSGTQTNNPGLRVVTQEGQRLFVLDDPTAKNAWLLPGTGSSAVLLWEQVTSGGAVPVTTIGWRSMKPGSVSETQWVPGSENATNATGLRFGDRVLVAYEVKRPSKLNALRVSTVRL